MEERRLCEKQPCRAFLEFLLNLSSVTTTKWQLFFCLFNRSWFICGFNIQYWILFNPRNNSLPKEVSNSVQNRSYSKGGTYYFSVLLLILRFKANINSEYLCWITILPSYVFRWFNWLSPDLLALILLDVLNISLAFSKTLYKKCVGFFCCRLCRWKFKQTIYHNVWFLCI